MINKKEIYIKSISRTVFWTQFILFSAVFASFIVGGFIFLNNFYLETSSVSVSKIYPPDLQNLFSNINSIKDPLYLYIWPILCGLILFFTIFSWLIIKGSVKRNIEKMPVAKVSDSLKKDVTDDKELEKRKFLHLLSVLQEEGRFLDFLNEELDEFEDDEIGAAVRSIHKGCKESLKKYLKIEPLIEDEEDSVIEIPKGFNPDKIKLTGNVVGEPPFKAIVRHRGFRAYDINLPELKNIDDASFLVPAEVEVE